ncbi:MAG: methylmalonyl Co-A mutase-associated GTPase MeaB [Chloroflexi bacterium]|nr:methylmalonyl Co-A mutase-associated GTPase MeaB [Chloroflexota bacterium]
MTELIQRMLSGDKQSLARLITLVEAESPQVAQIMRTIYPYTGKAFCVGVTGPPGGGKSTLVARLTSIAREKGLQVGIIAVDPTSPFSGGAILGDRIRMQRHYLDEGVFIRSMATRGSHGGLPRTASSVIKLLDACGKDIILVETVGVGQTEIDIMEAADTTIVVLYPEAGDSIQTMKAGLMEIADIFAINKADRPGADYLVAELEGMLHQSPKQSWWQVPVIATQAVNNIGIAELYEQIECHRRALEQSDMLALKRSRQRKADLLRTIENRIMAQVVKQIEQDGQLAGYLEKVEKGQMDPYSAASEILTNQTLIESWLRRVRQG